MTMTATEADERQASVESMRLAIVLAMKTCTAATPGIAMEAMYTLLVAMFETGIDLGARANVVEVMKLLRADMARLEVRR